MAAPVCACVRPTGSRVRSPCTRGTATPPSRSSSVAAPRPPCPAERALHDGPEGLYCSITGRLFVDPVSTADGQIYEKAAISRWLARKNTSPNTNVVLEDKSLVALPAVRTMVAKLVDAETLPKEEVRDYISEME